MDTTPDPDGVCDIVGATEAPAADADATAAAPAEPEGGEMVVAGGRQGEGGACNPSPRLPRESAERSADAAITPSLWPRVIGPFTELTENVETS
mmetsp:Transcript_66357/g.144032  ORF Transcript_66357/g.144032 Transcript_66357/m.144032 type:complete len:94 (+) Transcript_66357:727-1008(+)